MRGERNCPSPPRRRHGYRSAASAGPLEVVTSPLSLHSRDARLLPSMGRTKGCKLLAADPHAFVLLGTTTSRQVLADHISILILRGKGRATSRTASFPAFSYRFVLAVCPPANGCWAALTPPLLLGAQWRGRPVVRPLLLLLLAYGLPTSRISAWHGHIPWFSCAPLRTCQIQRRVLSATLLAKKESPCSLDEGRPSTCSHNSSVSRCDVDFPKGLAAPSLCFMCWCC